MIRNIAIIVMLFGITKFAVAQELHFNQWEFAPLMLSPSKTGAYMGSFRVGAIIKDKWGTADPKSWKTVEGYIDAPIIRGLRKSDWIAVGIGYDYDVAGDSDLKQQFQRLNLAYHFGFGKKLKSSFTIGGQFVNAGLTLSKDLLDLSETGRTLRMDGVVDPNLSSWIMKNQGQMGPEASFKTWATSVAYTSQLSKKSTISMGLSVSQFLSENQGFVSIDPLPARYIGYFEMKNWTGKRSYFAPRIVYSRQGANDKIYIQSMFGYRMKPKLTLNYGLGLNILTTLNVPIYLGMEYNGIKAGLAYSVDLGATQATNTYGGMELGISYIHILAKKPKPKPVIICPRL